MQPGDITEDEVRKLVEGGLDFWQRVLNGLRKNPNCRLPRTVTNGGWTASRRATMTRPLPIYGGHPPGPEICQGVCSRGETCEKNREHDKAVDDFTKAIRLDPKYVDAYCGRGIAYGAKRDFDKAIDDCTEAIRLAPNYPKPYSTRGRAYGSKGNFDKAIGDCTEAVQLNPNDAEPYSSRGNVYTMKGEDDKAIADYTEAIGQPETCRGP